MTIYYFLYTGISERPPLLQPAQALFQAALLVIWFNDRKIVDTVNITPQG